MNMIFDQNKLESFENAIRKLEMNRKQVPLELLTTKYRVSWEALIKEVQDLSEWYADAFIAAFQIPLDEKYEAGNVWMQKKIRLIKVEEHGPGRMYEQIRNAIPLTMSWNAFGKVVFKLYKRIEDECFSPYVRKFNRTIGDRVYNDLFKAFWTPDPDCYGGGYWLTGDGALIVTSGYNPEGR